MGKLQTLPEGYMQCQWCGGGVRLLEDGTMPARCRQCGLHPGAIVDPTVGGKVDPTAPRSRRDRRMAPRQKAFDPEPQGTPVLGVDPGAVYTGVVLRDGDHLAHATTLVGSTDADPVEWARRCVEDIKVILTSQCPAETRIAIEGVSKPKGFKDGKRASIDPQYIIRAGVVLGAVAATWPEAHIVPPGRNGSQHITHYPAALVGARPADLPGSTNGAGTRDHEKSAWDVAGRGALHLWPPETPTLRELWAAQG